MTAFNTDVYTSQVSGQTSYQTSIPGRDLKGRLREFKTTMSEVAFAADDTVSVCNLPAGARVLWFHISHPVMHASNGDGDPGPETFTDCTLALSGNDGSARTFVTAYSGATAATDLKPSEYQGELAAETTLTLTVAAAAPDDTTVAVNITVFAVLPN